MLPNRLASVARSCGLSINTGLTLGRNESTKGPTRMKYGNNGDRPSVPFCIDAAMATQSFIFDNEAARKAVESSKDRHARRWQTKEGTYRVKQQFPPDVRDGGDVSMGDA